jgi:hypothetical protein
LGLFNALFRRHMLGRVAWEVETHLIRMAGDWAAAVNGAVGDPRARAAAWVDTELGTLDRLLKQPPTEAGAFGQAHGRG